MDGYILKVQSNAFQEGDWIPIRYTGRGEDVSPCIELTGIDLNAQSIAITFDDASHPIFPNYNHWVIWNIPIQSVIPEAVPHGKVVENLKEQFKELRMGKIDIRDLSHH